MEHSLSYYNSQYQYRQPNHEFLICSFALHEVMPPVAIYHGHRKEYPWPWLFIFFEDPVTVNFGKEDVDIPENTLVIWEPETIHSYKNLTKSWSHSWLIIDCPDMEFFVKNWSLPTQQPIFCNVGNIFAKCLNLFHEELSVNEDDILYQQLLFQLFLHDLHRQCDNKYQIIPEKMKKVVSYMTQHISEDLSVEMIASSFGFSISQFSSLFRKYYQTSPIQYLNTMRLNQAARLLSLYPYSCQQVAQMCGFKDPLYFSRKFTQYWGMSPRAYRNKLK